MNRHENLHFEGSESSPEVYFEADGKLKIAGKAIPDNAISFFEPLFMWIENLDCEKVVFDISLEYMNTSATMQLFGLLQRIEENSSIDEIVVNWHYEVDDEDHYDTGLMFEERLNRITFNYLSIV